MASNELNGHVYSAWEDPGHPNRFYEVVVCHGLEALDLLTNDRSELAGLDAQIEACWGVLPERGADAPRLVALTSAGESREDRVA